MNTEKLIELAGEVERLLRYKMDSDGYCTMSTQFPSFWASNQPDHAIEITFKKSSKSIISMTEDEKRSHNQGFCFLVTLRSEWGGKTHEGKELQGNRVIIGVYDKRNSWNGPSCALEVNKQDKPCPWLQENMQNPTAGEIIQKITQMYQGDSPSDQAGVNQKVQEEGSPTLSEMESAADAIFDWAQNLKESGEQTQATAPKYHIEKITGDNRRPGMKHSDGYLIRYRPHPNLGWLGCKTVATKPEAEAFAATLTPDGDLEVPREPEQADRIKMFATHNDTDSWAVCVDGRFGLYADREEALRVYRLIGGQGDPSDALAETPFGSSVLLSPRHTERRRDGSEPEGGFDRISVHEPIDIEKYIRDEWKSESNGSALPESVVEKKTPSPGM